MNIDEKRLEWVNSLPPVGCECEFKTEAREGLGNFANDWENCVVKYASENGAFLLDEYRNEIFMDSIDYLIMFRPIRTQAERERESAIDHAFSKLTELREARQVLGDLYDAGLLPRTYK